MNITQIALKQAGFSREQAAEKLKTSITTVKAMEEDRGERAQLINRCMAFAVENQPDLSEGREHLCAVRILAEVAGASKHLEDMSDIEIDRLTRKVACMIRFRGNH